MYALVDCDNFFCSCEKVFRPDLEGMPLVVLSNNDGCVVARSKEAKKIGVSMGLPFYQMKKRFPHVDIKAFSSNYVLYADMSARVMATLRLDAPEVHQYSIDEAFIDLKGMERFNLKEWGERLAAKVLKWTGIPVSIGIAPTKTLAKVAARFAKKYAGYHKCCIIANDAHREQALKLTEVEDVWGIGRRHMRSLKLKSVYSAYDFTKKPRYWVKKFYHVSGERIWLELQGHDVLSFDCAEKKQSIVTSRTFPGMYTTMEELTPHIANYAARCALKLRKQKSVCGMITVFVRTNPFRDDLPQFSCHDSHVFSTATANTGEIVEAALLLLRAIYAPGFQYKKAGVIVDKITSAEAIQPDLFDFDAHRRKKLDSIAATMDRINAELGNDTLILASQQYMEKEHDGKAVRFSNAIRREILSPAYSTSFQEFKVK